MRWRTLAVVSRKASIFGIILMALAATGDAAQFRQRGRGFGPSIEIPTDDSFDGRFNFCRVAFQGNRMGRGGGWFVDYPRADENLSIRLSELTRTPVSFDSSHEPRHFVVRLTDPSLFQCPFIMMTEVGALYMDDEEAARLKEYLLKGGFLWADDFWGSYAWRAFEDQIRKALPAAEYPIVDLPLDHPLFHTMFDVKHVQQIPSINYWAGSGGGTSEAGADSAVPHARGIFDERGRLVVFITHNTDYGDSWEQEATDPNYFLEFAIDGYALGIDTVLYALTH